MKAFFQKLLDKAVHPVSEPEDVATGLQFTDVLFGFVISELFVRLQNLNWTNLPIDIVRCHLVVGTVLVLGSWIGFRNSRYRTRYQLKFFNLPLLRFIVDQLMLILYFSIAVLTPKPDVHPAPAIPLDLAQHTAELIVVVLIYYVIWDLIGIWMAKARVSRQGGARIPLYPTIDKQNEKTDQWAPVNWWGFRISLSALVVSAILLADVRHPRSQLILTALLLLAYRWAKEIKTSW